MVADPYPGYADCPHPPAIWADLLTRDRLVAHMFQDKKVDAGELVFILAKGIGASEIRRDVSLDQLRAVLDHA